MLRVKVTFSINSWRSVRAVVSGWWRLMVLVLTLLWELIECQEPSARCVWHTGSSGSGWARLFPFESVQILWIEAAWVDVSVIFNPAALTLSFPPSHFPGNQTPEPLQPRLQWEREPQKPRGRLQHVGHCQSHTVSGGFWGFTPAARPNSDKLSTYQPAELA